MPTYETGQLPFRIDMQDNPETKCREFSLWCGEALWSACHFLLSDVTKAAEKMEGHLGMSAWDFFAAAANNALFKKLPMLETPSITCLIVVESPIQRGLFLGIVLALNRKGQPATLHLVERNLYSEDSEDETKANFNPYDNIPCFEHAIGKKITELLMSRT